MKGLFKFIFNLKEIKFLSNFNGNIKAKQVLKNIINLAKDLGMQTLTEGVETQEAYDFLREIGCEKLQGYLFSKPITKSEIEAQIDDGSFILD